MNTQFFDINGERIRVATQGGQMGQRGEGTPLLICNEIGANLELLTPLLEALPDTGWAVFDAPGCGESSSNRLRLRFSAYTSLLTDLMDALGWRGKVDVMGIGWGGLLLQQLAREAPHRLRRLVLAATSPGQIMFPGRLKSVAPLLWRRRFSSPERFAGMAHSTYGGLARYEPERVRRNAEQARMPSRRGYAMQLAAAAGFSSLPWLHRINRPVLILAGDDDPIVPMVNARILNFLIPQSRLISIKGGGHLFPVTRPAETARAIDNFCRRRHVRDELSTKDFV